MPQNLSNLIIGSKIKMGKHQISNEVPQELTWRYLQRNHAGYPSGSATLMSEYIIDIMSMDASEPPTSSFGNPAYNLSNMRQWLNSDAGAGQWYSATHSDDQPPNLEFLPATGSVPYEQRAGFLHYFTDNEKSLLMPTTVYTQDVGAFTDEVQMIDKVFLPSGTEIGSPFSDYDFMSNNTLINGFSNTASQNSPLWNVGVSPQVLEHSEAMSASSSERVLGLRTWTGRLGNISRDQTNAVQYVIGQSAITRPSIASYTTIFDIRPIINIPQTTQVSDSPDSDGYYTLYFPEPIPAPTDLTLLSDPVLFSYGVWEFEDLQNVNGTDYEYRCTTYRSGLIYEQNTFNSYNVAGKVRFVTRLGAMPDIPTSNYTITVEVRAIVDGTPSDWVSSGVITLSNANYNFTYTLAPTSGNYGELSETQDFDLSLTCPSNAVQWTHVIKDDMGDITTSESGYEIVDIVKYNNSPTDLARIENKSYVFDFSNDKWLPLPNDTVYNFYDYYTSENLSSPTENITPFKFTKKVDTLSAELVQPIFSEERPYRIRLDARRKEALDTLTKIYVANNGYDEEPTWEDATAYVANGHLSYVFENETKTDEFWGVVFRIEMTSSDATKSENVLQRININFEV